MNKMFLRILLSAISPMICVFLAACGQEQDDVDVSLINMMYACEGPRYKIFHIGPVSNEPGNEIDIDIEENSLLAKQLADAFAEAEENKIGEKDILGRDVDLIFKTKEQSEDFYKKEGPAPICNIYEVRGFLSNDQLVVERFRIIVRKNCLTEEPVLLDAQN